MSPGSPNAKLFINYRRDDTAPYAGRLYDRLAAHFGADQVFMDIDQIEPGEDFVEVINRKVGACEIAIISIGPNWLSAKDASGKRRLDDTDDFVRMEIIAALERKIRVIPVLVGGAHMPRKQDLPEALAPLSRRNAIELSETRFHSDVSRLIEAIEKPRVFPEKATEPLPGSVALMADPAPPVELPDPEILQKISASRPLAEKDAERQLTEQKEKDQRGDDATRQRELAEQQRLESERKNHSRGRSGEGAVGGGSTCQGKGSEEKGDSLQNGCRGNKERRMRTALERSLCRRLSPLSKCVSADETFPNGIRIEENNGLCRWRDPPAAGGSGARSIFELHA